MRLGLLMKVRLSVVFIQLCNLAMHIVQMKIYSERYCIVIQICISDNR